MVSLARPRSTGRMPIHSSVVPPRRSFILPSFLCALFVLLLAPVRPSSAPRPVRENAERATAARRQGTARTRSRRRLGGGRDRARVAQPRGLELSGGPPVSLTITIRSFESSSRLQGNVSFVLRGEEAPPITDDLTCAASLSFGCGVVANFSMPRKQPDAPAVFESEVEDGVVWIRSDRNRRGSDAASDDFEQFVAAVIEHPRVAVRVRVDQRQDSISTFAICHGRWPTSLTIIPSADASRTTRCSPACANGFRRAI